MRLSALLIGSALAGCSPQVPPPPAAFKLDCSLGYETLTDKIAALPGIQLAKTPNEPYHYFNSPEGDASYVVTLKGGAGHPAVIAQYATPKGMQQSGCPYGDQIGYGKLTAYLQILAEKRRP